ncbi:hypothetical protein [Micromonospora sp. WMMD1082]|uniref:hypothetical protein n=1 Tax=Micromonospora sp. WMMD1082 TaxID=3016104 RepID=UPI002417230E|nr:hypothetical protein [Micromonospora sp. WMMD1082]MDG4795039.1 hypothetical protein [Micromonospora sp. WMMD1082]
MDTKTAKPDPIEVVAQTLRTRGQLTAAAIAEETGMAYSTVTPKLRALEDAVRAERVKINGRTFWRLTTAPAQAPTADSGDTASVPDANIDTTTTTEPPPPAEAAPTTTDDGTSDPGHTTDADPTPTPDAASPADTPDRGPDAPAGTPAANPAPDPAPASEPTATAPGDQASGDSASAAHPTPEPAPGTSAADGTNRRPSGALGSTALRVMRANPDTPYKVTELARLIDRADAADGHTYPKASPGAVVLVCDRLVGQGYAIKVVEKPATYQLAATPPANP